MANDRGRKQRLVRNIERRIHYRFRDPGLAVLAMTHSSAKEEEEGNCNERMEFLGDAILGQIVCEHLFRRFPSKQEGELSVIKSILVSSRMLAKASRKLGLESAVITGKGIPGNRLPTSILANAFEALTAAIYLDSGLQEARRFVLRHLVDPNLDEVADRPQERNFKSLLQDYAQKAGIGLPEYRVKKAVGPDHRKRFLVSVSVDGKTYGPTWGYSKKEAEQRAALDALVTLGVLPAGSAESKDA